MEKNPIYSGGFVRYISNITKIDKTTYFNTIVQHICQMEVSNSHFFELIISQLCLELKWLIIECSDEDITILHALQWQVSYGPDKTSSKLI